MSANNKIIVPLDGFRSSESGQVAVFLALLAIPVLVTVSVAVDSQRNSALEARLSSALDNAALASIANQTLTDQARAEAARTYFQENIGSQADKIDFQVMESTAERVTLEATADLKTSFMHLVGKETSRVKDSSSAEVTEGDVICMLALDPDGERSFEVTGGARLTSPNCSVQVNSSHQKAAIIDHGGEARSKDFCVTGGAQGKFEPFVNTECRSVEDPFIDIMPPTSGACMDSDIVNASLTSWQSEAGGVKLSPGTYCGGLVFFNKKVDFEPGTYIIQDGPLIFDNGSRITANDVTFVLQGDRARLIVNEGSRVSLRAPVKGKFANLAFFQDVTYKGSSEFYPYATYGDPKYFQFGYGYHEAARSGRELDGLLTESIVSRGSSMSVTGVVYLPGQKIHFRGGSLLENQAPATSFIGYQISIGDGASVHVDVDHVSANINPIEPRSDESVRLVR